MRRSAVRCVLCNESVDAGHAHVVVHGFGSVCWSCSRHRDVDDWGVEQFEAIVAKVVAHAGAEHLVTGIRPLPPVEDRGP